MCAVLPKQSHHYPRLSSCVRTLQDRLPEIAIHQDWWIDWISRSSRRLRDRQGSDHCRWRRQSTAAYCGLVVSAAHTYQMRTELHYPSEESKCAHCCKALHNTKFGCRVCKKRRYCCASCMKVDTDKHTRKWKDNFIVFKSLWETCRRYKTVVSCTYCGELRSCSQLCDEIDSSRILRTVNHTE